jgi:hypothetical protein
MKFARSVRFVPALLAALSLIVSSTPLLVAYGQTKAPVKKPTADKAASRKPTTPYGIGYQKGYNDGFLQGQADWHNNASPDFRRSDKWQKRDAGASEEFRLGYELGFELSYTDGYYGRARNAEIPRNGEVIAKAASLADQRSNGDQRSNRDRQNNNRFDRPESIRVSVNRMGPNRLPP